MQESGRDLLNFKQVMTGEDNEVAKKPHDFILKETSV